jgi:hypothetical protein
VDARIDSHFAIVRLSKRNLLALLDKVDRPESVATIYKRCDGVIVSVCAELDDKHYEGRTAGRMERGTEARIQEQGSYDTVA